ncbi:MAG: hypothetical protein U0270_00115 [Labilithrix sp.]
MRSEIQASDFPARRAHVQNVERRSWKRSGSTLSALSSKRIARVTFAVFRSLRSTPATRFAPPFTSSSLSRTIGSSSSGFPRSKCHASSSAMSPRSATKYCARPVFVLKLASVPCWESTCFHFCASKLPLRCPVNVASA